MLEIIKSIFGKEKSKYPSLNDTTMSIVESKTYSQGPHMADINYLLTEVNEDVRVMKYADSKITDNYILMLKIAKRNILSLEYCSPPQG